MPASRPLTPSRGIDGPKVLHRAESPNHLETRSKSRDAKCDYVSNRRGSSFRNIPIDSASEKSIQA
ncbi:hypothetical protein MJO28_002378 [Puccinia striiformis f. sp. tritici]|uniref:Uncharacterized protein n=1 Tax=Puccinia striiformis f. sp. tritici TaxID=168172 RepID=A0ACC0EVV4_9BASI|nr:hypothetical protein MJO28_002378 [Puccinia striiformis f. sp. tritici]KAI7966708.1 hypothetical protein MJO29_002456 [Puccinia striiformis f. sp. tritici]